MNGVTKVKMVSVNTEGTTASTYQYLTVESLGLPATTQETSPFQMEVIDPNNLLIEKVLAGQGFKATPGILSRAQVLSTNQVINA